MPLGALIEPGLPGARLCAGGCAMPAAYGTLHYH